jgi:hypothetical protein
MPHRYHLLTTGRIQPRRHDLGRHYGLHGTTQPMSSRAPRRPPVSLMMVMSEEAALAGEGCAGQQVAKQCLRPPTSSRGQVMAVQPRTSQARPAVCSLFHVRARPNTAPVLSPDCWAARHGCGMQPW